jgi:hypothetical protein
MTHQPRRQVRTAATLALIASVATSPLRAQVLQEDPAVNSDRHAAASSLTDTASPWRPRPLTASALAIAEMRSGELTQTPPAARKRCDLRVVLGTAIGAGAGTAVGVGVLAATGGSDSTADVLKGFSVLGAIFGAVGGLLSCTP